MSASSIVTGVQPAAGMGQACGSESQARPELFGRASFFQSVFSFAAMLGTCLIARVFLTLRDFQVDPDVWWHIKVGEDILSSHRWPTADAYSFTVAGQHWFAYQWLGDVLLAAVYRDGGLRGLGALLIVLGSLVALTLYWFTTIRCGNPKAAFVASALLLNLAMASFNLRPQMLGYLFLVITLLLLERFRQGKQGTLWLLPLVFVLWVNVHGSWIVGLATVGVYLASGIKKIRVGALETQPWNAAEIRRLAIVLVLCALGIFVTPYGASLAKYPFEMASSAPQTVASIQEWQPLGFKLPGDKLFLVLFLGFFAWQLVSRRKWRLEEVVLFLAGAGMACVHMRLLLVFVPFCAALMSVVFAEWLSPYDHAKEIYLLNGAVMLAVVTAMVWYFPSQAAYASAVDEAYPAAAVHYLESHSVPGPMFNRYEFGGYILWTRSGENRVFIDGRTDLYEHGGVLADYLALTALKTGSLSVLDKYKIQSCLLWRAEPLATVLGQLPEWQKVYTDDRTIIFVRKVTGSQQAANASSVQTDGN